MSWELFFFFEEEERHSGKEAKKEEIENWSNGGQNKIGGDRKQWSRPRSSKGSKKIS